MNKESKENLQKELREMGSSLQGPPAMTAAGSGVPQDYFEKFPDRLQQKLAGKPAVIGFFPWQSLVPAMATVALIIAVMVSFLLINNPTGQGLFSQGEDTIVDEYLAIVSQYDHSLMYEVASQDALFDDNHQFIPGNATQAEEDPMIDYMLEMAEYHGLNTTRLIAEQDQE